MSDYPAEWVEKAAEALYSDQMLDMPDDYQWPWTKQDEEAKTYWRALARAVLDAVAPTIRADAEADRDFWKKNDNDRSAEVRKARAERDALRDGIRELADDWESMERFPATAYKFTPGYRANELRALLDREVAQ